MAATIVRLYKTRRSSVRCPETGVFFPQVYRLRGVTWQEKAGLPETPNGGFVEDENIEPSQNKWPPLYTLDPDQDMGLASVYCEAIDHLWADDDEGWVFVRHHLTRDALEGYLDGLQDMRHECRHDDVHVYETEWGLFTLLHRSATPGLRDRLLIYQTKIADPFGGHMDWACVVDERGIVLDIDDLMPEAVRQQYDKLFDHLK